MFKQFSASCTLALILAFGLALPAQAQNFDSMQDSAQTAPPTQAAQPAPTPAGVCGDDPRLESELLTLLQSNAPINPPLTVSPETFLNMDSEVLQVLGGQMIICPNIPVLKGGKPMKKVPVDFESIWDNIRKAAIAGDEARLKQVLTGFTAKPKTAQEIVNMLSPVDLDESTRKTLYKAAGIELPKDNDESLIIDFYKALGGTTNDQTFVAVHPSFNLIKREEYEQHYGKFIDLSTAGQKQNELFIRKLRLVGVNAI